MNTINATSLINYAPPRLEGGVSSSSSSTRQQETVSSQAPKAQARSSGVDESVVRQYLDRLAVAGFHAGTTLSRRAIGVYNSVARLSDREYVSKVMGVDEFA